MSDFKVVSNDQYYFQTMSPNPNILAIQDSNGEKILEIASDGTVTWHQKTKSVEAAQVFVDAIQFGVETKADIKQGRKEWEDEIRSKLLAAAEEEPLTPEKLTEVLNKCIMLDKLKGNK